MVVSKTTSSVTLSWDVLDSGVVEYVIEYRAPDKTSVWREWYGIDYRKTTATILGLASETVYEFRIKVTTAAGYSTYSEVITTTTDSFN